MFDEYYNDKVDCMCGVSVMKSRYKNHLCSLHHQRYINKPQMKIIKNEKNSFYCINCNKTFLLRNKNRHLKSCIKINLN